jgi:teichuronic acid biosynthesis glycosyltransferase TuaC
MSLIRALCISRNYPNESFPRLGIWTQRLAAACSGWCETRVIAPVPWFPPVQGTPYSRYASIVRHERAGGMEVFHPRFLLLPGMALHSLEAISYYGGVRRLVERLRSDWPFDLIHAHFIYPDGVVAARLSEEIGVPFLVTEQASWKPWLDDYPLVRRQAVAAAHRANRIIAVSRALAGSIASFGIQQDHISVVPNVVDGEVFGFEGPREVPTQPRLLFVGVIRKVKGLDVLLRALRLLLDSDLPVELAIVGESFYSSYARDYRELRALSDALGLDESVRFLGAMTGPQVAAEMRRSSLLVLPSRRETFGAVLAESLACGTPVVATRCGGPEDIVDDDVGVLVEPGDPGALADGIRAVLSRQGDYDPARLRRHSLSRFGTDVVSRQLQTIYRDALA